MNIEKITIPARDGYQLSGLILSNPTSTGKKPVILVIHGWTSSKTRYPSRVEPLVEMGYLVFLFDLRGHGESEGELGKLSIKDHLADCLVAYDFLLSYPEADENNISVIGSSYGGYLASLLSTKRKIHHLALSVPALYPNEIFDSPKGLQRSEETINYRTKYHAADDDFALQAIKKFDGQVLLIQAEKDEVIPASVIKSYLDASKDKVTHKIIAESDHSMSTNRSNEERIRIQTEWFIQFI